MTGGVSMFPTDYSLNIGILYDKTKSKHVLKSFSKQFPHGVLMWFSVKVHTKLPPGVKYEKKKKTLNKLKFLKI